MSKLHNRLKELRQQNNIMVKTMAELLNITPRNYQRYENGEVDPPTSKTIILADYFNVSLDYLVGRTDNPEINK
ncbi:MAG: helix-turn-helix transcriptional regulator [Clostridiales bacterium]|jgi:transcriptional regulator with XRE-family HTH domain|nr:helix-turn-helix transcriptional regulator [Clostridiales bacterium]